MDLIDRLREAYRFDEIRELDEGHQARVFEVVHRGERMIAKAVEATADGRALLEARLDVIDMLGELDQPVCRPLWIGDERTIEIDSDEGEHLVVCFEFADGPHPEPSSRRDAQAMGTLLGVLHLAMAQLPPMPLPPVAALEAVPIGQDLHLSTPQLLHGDFGANNLRGDAGLRVFDFDDCGYGPPEFDVANATYMVLFDSVVHDRTDDFETFRGCFVDAYSLSSGRAIASDTLDALIDLRVRALGAWLDDLANAPVGIRDSSPEWRATLRSFVDGQGAISRW